jgi:membrane protease YdiL (CAAX protease family)
MPEGPTTGSERPVTAPVPPTPSGSMVYPPAPAPKPMIAPVHFERVPWKRVGLFLLIAYAVMALFAAPFWFLPGGITHPLFTPVIAVGMWAPALASVILAKGVEKTNWRTRVGLRFRGRWKKILAWSPLAVLIALATQVLGVVIMVLRGVPGDLTGRTWLRLGTEQLSQAAGTEIPPAVLIVSILFGAVFGLVITVVATLGEEIGWRGWLWPALKPLGRIRAAIVLGVVWSLWHLPIVLIGYNYPGEPRYLAVPMFMLPCIAMALLFGALTDRARGNPIPAAFAHATVNSWGSVVLSIAATGGTVAGMNMFIDTGLGITGVVLVALAGVLVMPWRRGKDGARSAAGTVGPDGSVRPTSS